MLDTLRPENPLQFIRECVCTKKIFRTYHVNMRLRERMINRDMVLHSIEFYEIIESYPDDRYLPSYLVYTHISSTVLHILFAVDTNNDNVRVITAYFPDPGQWDETMKRRL
jgi:hypothetical protein